MDSAILNPCAIPEFAMLKKIPVLFLSLLAGMASAADRNDAVEGASALPAAETLSLDAALAKAMANNQGLAELRLEAESLGSVPSQAGALPDPVLGLNALNVPTDTFDLDQEPMTQLQVSLGQTFPFPGKRSLREEVAEYEASAAQRKVAEKQLLIAASVRSAWWQLNYLDRAIEIVKQNQDLMRDFVEIAGAKYKVGMGLQQDVLLAQLELSRLLNRELPLRGMRDAYQADLNSLMNLPANQPVRLPPEMPDSELAPLQPEADLLQRALETRPLLDQARDNTEAARLRLNLANKEYYPDLRLGAAYGYRDATDATGRDLPDLVSFQIGINLPIYSSSKQSKAVDQQSSAYFKNKHAFAEALRSVQAEISRNYAQYQASRDQVSLYRSAIIPQAQQTVAAMLSGYQVSKVDFLNVLNAQLTLSNAQISYWEALSNAKKSLASLAASVGSEDLYE